MERSNIMSDSLNAKYALAFGIDLQRQLAAVQLEDCQIIRRSLDRDFPFGRPHVAWAVFRPAFVSEDRLYSLQVQRRSAAIDQGLEDLLHAPANRKDQISAILHLVVGEVIPKPAAFLFLEVERKTQTGAVNPPLTDLTQSPYSPLLGQGLCDLCEAGCVANCSKTVAVFDEPDARLARLTGDVFMAVQDHLGWERRMAADPDGDMPPITGENAERGVVHIRLLPLKVVIRLDVPHRCLGATDQDQKQTFDDRCLGQIIVGDVMLTLPCHTLDDRNVVRLGVASHASTEPAGQPHQVSVVQRVVRSGERPPPHAETARTMPHPEVRVQNDAVHTIVAAAQQFLVELAQTIRHDRSPRVLANTDLDWRRA